MELREIYRAHYGGLTFSNLHVASLLADALVWCRKYELCANELIQDAALRVEFELPRKWITESGEWGGSSDSLPVYEASPMFDDRVALFDKVLALQPGRSISPRWRAVIVFSSVMESFDGCDEFIACADDAEVLFNLMATGLLVAVS